MKLIWDLALAAFLIWLGNHARIKYWGLFALYVAGYSGYRIFEEAIRIDSSEYFLGLRLNMYVAIFGTLAGLFWVGIVQRRPQLEAIIASPMTSEAPDAANALDDAAENGSGGGSDDHSATDHSATDHSATDQIGTGQDASAGDDDAEAAEVRARANGAAGAGSDG